MTGEGEVIQRGMENDRFSCSIVIRAYNEAEHIGRLLAGIHQQTVKNLEVILVDSGSSDATVSIAEGINRNFPLKVVHIQPAEFTFGYSLNQGIAAARGEIIIIASAHVYPVYPDWIERLLAPFTDLQTGLVYGKQRGDSNTHFSEKQVFVRWYPEETQLRQIHPFCNNANAAIRRSLWENHPYDEALSGLEDLAWARDIMDQGYKLAYIAEAEVIHVHDETPQAIFNRYRREAMAYKRIFPQEKFGFLDFVRLYTSNAASDLWHAAKGKIFWRVIRSILWFRWMQFWGTYQGFRHSGPLTWQLRKTFYYPRGLGEPARPRSRDIEPIRYAEPVEEK
jgi:rhamnosyltransferase